MRSIRRLFAGLALATLLVAGAGTAYAVAQASPMMGVMTGGGGMGSMMENDEGGSMRNGGMTGGDQTRAMGSFDEDRPFDLQFIDQMIMHHEGAIMSSEHMISDSERPELRELAENIEESQSGQIDQMREWRDVWYPDAGQTSGMPAGTMDEMMGQGMMEQMMGGSMQEMMGGDAADEMFLRMMIPHHQMAVGMSKKALERSGHPELEDLARKIIDEQKAEIELMEGYLKEIERTEKG